MKKNKNKSKRIRRDSSILDELSSISDETKDRIIKQNEELDDSNNNANNKQIGRRIEDAVIHYDINDDDSVFISSLKNYINSLEILKSEFYNMVGSTSKAYGLYYSFSKGRSSFRVFEEMLEILNKDIEVEFIDKDEPIKYLEKPVKENKPVKKTFGGVEFTGRKIENLTVHYDITDEDSDFQRILKELINEEEIDKEEVYKRVGRKQGYHLIYTIQKNVQSFKIFEQWCEVLNKEIIIRFLDK
jgi:hypothetical protein